MSSGYGGARVSAREAERLRKQAEKEREEAKKRLIAAERKKVAEQIAAAKETVSGGKPASVGVTSLEGFRQTVFATDDLSGGVDLDLIVEEMDLDIPEETAEDRRLAEKARLEREELDFTSLIASGAGRKPSRAEMELAKLLEKVEERPVITEKDAEDRKRLRAEIARVLSDDSYDAQAKADFLRLRIDTYLRGGVRLTPENLQLIQDEYLDYCALCALLGMKPVETIPYRVRKEIRRMNEVLVKRRENEYIIDTIDEIMEELGCHVRGEAVLDEDVGQLYSVDGNEMCEVFIAAKDGQILFETIAQTQADTARDKEKLEQNAQRVCDLYDEIEKRASERGIIITRKHFIPAAAEKLASKSEVTEREGKKKRTKTKKIPKEMALEN